MKKIFGWLIIFPGVILIGLAIYALIGPSNYTETQSLATPLIFSILAVPLLVIGYFLIKERFWAEILGYLISGISGVLVYVLLFNTINVINFLGYLQIIYLALIFLVGVYTLFKRVTKDRL